MSALVNASDGRRPPQLPGRLRQVLAASALIGLLAVAIPSGLQAADCPAERQPNIPKSEEPALNIDKHKKQLRAYKSDGYDKDIKLVFDDASGYVMSRIDNVKRPAIVLDIDETSLSNWPNIDADDFGFIQKGSCPLRPHFPCGFDAWVGKGRADKIAPTLEFFNAVRSRKVAIFFVTGRRDAQRAVTVRNLRRAGFEGWTGLMTRPDDDHGSVMTFKSGERAKIEKDNDKRERYTIIANIGDQQSDLDGDHAECKFKVPNPFYFIP
jgi:predicted secreted acid phosphatase